MLCPDTITLSRRQLYAGEPHLAGDWGRDAPPTPLHARGEGRPPANKKASSPTNSAAPPERYVVKTEIKTEINNNRPRVIKSPSPSWVCDLEVEFNLSPRRLHPCTWSTPSPRATAVNGTFPNWSLLPLSDPVSFLIRFSLWTEKMAAESVDSGSRPRFEAWSAAPVTWSCWRTVQVLSAAMDGWWRRTARWDRAPQTSR